MKKAIWPLLFVLLTQIISFAQNSVTSPAPAPGSQTAKRPRVAIALSGGGARGLAHIGVIQWLEENRIPVDFVAGSSMGAVIGATYASGMTPAAMREFMDAIDWDEVMLSEPRYDDISFRRKEDRRDFPFGLPLGWKHGVRAPNGLNPGHGVGLVLDRLALPYYGISDFDQLPIPFRCVATDMLKGEPVTLKSGSLSQALRATISLPGFFTPAELDGKMLSDGGLTNNIPTDVARQMGADIVIAIDVTTPLAGRQDLQSVGGVLDQSISVMTIDNDRRSLQSADVVIAPDLGAYGRFDYAAANRLIQLGYDAAARKALVLRPFALSETEWAAYLDSRNARRRTAPAEFASLQVSGVQGNAKDRLQSRLNNFVGGRELDPRQLEDTLTHITGEGRFDSLGYEGFISNPEPGLLIRAHQKTYGPPFVNLLLAVNGSDVGDYDFIAGARITLMDIGSFGGELRTDIKIGSESFIGAELYQRLGKTHLFFAPRIGFQDGSRDFFATGQKVATYSDRREIGGIDLGWDSGYRSEVRLGYQVARTHFTPVVGTAGIPPMDGNTTQLRLRWIFDGQDSPTIPSRGFRLVSQATHVFSSPGVRYDFNQFQIQTSGFVPVSRRGSLFVMNSLGTTLNHDAAPLQLFSLGGLFRLGAYRPDELLGNHYVLGVAGYRHEIGRLPMMLGQKVYLGSWYEVGSAFNVLDSAKYQHVFSAGIIADTILGPVAFSTSAGTNGKKKVRFSLGRLF